MTVHHQQYPTRGDLAREQLRRRGFSDPAEVRRDIAARVTALAPRGAAAFALGCAERLLRGHERLSEEERRPFTLGWRPVLNDIRAGLEGNDAAARLRVQAALDRYYSSPFHHEDGQDGPDDADEDAAAACIYATECSVNGVPITACGAANRALSVAFEAAARELQLDPNDFEWDPDAEPMPLVREAMHPFVQEELRRQLADIEALERQDVNADVLHRLFA